MIRKLAPLVLLAGCTVAQSYDTDIGPLLVYFDDQNTYFTGPALIDGFEVEPFPVPGSLVVVRPDGTDLVMTPETSAAARDAMERYCMDQTGSRGLVGGGFQNGRFAGLCEAPAL